MTAMDIREEKNALRREMKLRLAARNNAANAASASNIAAVARHLAELSALSNAQNLLIYLALPSEFPTRALLPGLFLNRQASAQAPPKEAQNEPRNIIIPWCDGENIELFLLLSPRFAKTDHSIKTPQTTNFAEIVQNTQDSAEWQNQLKNYDQKLSAGSFGILEPKPELRRLPIHQFSPEDLDAVLVPGLAFDRTGGRLGRGKGYYDRFFQKLPKKTLLIGLAFDEQVVERVPLEPHDRKIDLLVTPGGVWNASPFLNRGGNFPNRP